ncbi:P-loop containing nucleoside triphosphate hydrolase protein [Daedaleopsis nitida]|nr:P-loop containing nucleoside triphosphate hydrolase protein [Daedaleopsis nitida]
MTVDLQSHTTTTDAPRKEKKKSKKEKHAKHGADTVDLGADGAEKKKDKKKKKLAKADPEGEHMEVDVPEGILVSEEPQDTLSEKKSKKKRKRDAEENDTAADVSKKEKKRKRDSDIPPVVSVADDTQPDTKPLKEKKGKKDKKEKKDKKDKNKSKESSTSDPSSSSAPTATSTTHGVASSADIAAFLKKNEITLHIPDGSAAVTPILTFAQLDVPAQLRAAFDGFQEPTPIQACSWPPALEGRDVVGIAETGSGKTLAFGLPALARLLASPQQRDKKQKGTTVSVLVTHETLDKLGEPFGIASVAVFGGLDKGPQIKALKNMNKDGKTTRIVVGTPGRILDLVNEGACDLSRVSYLVLDEADRMLDRGFENDIRAIIDRTMQGSDRQTLMFSATWPDAVRRLASTFQRDPVRVTVGSDDLTANSRVEQVVEVFDDPRSKDSRLLGHLRTLMPKKSKGSADIPDARILVFALYKKETQRVESLLQGKGFSVAGLHGDMSQTARLDALQSFKAGTTSVLVATDVAARGLDIPNVGAVINYTFPLTIEDYIHRIGRTGRGGKTGKSITFFTGEGHERALAGELARVLRESGFEAEGLKKFPMTIKKKTHSAYGAFFRNDIVAPKAPTKITF